MNKFLIMLCALLIAVTYNDSFAARKKSGKKAKASTSKTYKAKKKTTKKAQKTSKKATQETEEVSDD